jgi:hypothetical protein
VNTSATPAPTSASPSRLSPAWPSAAATVRIAPVAAWAIMTRAPPSATAPAIAAKVARARVP